jgi:hypothetical protein
VSKKRHRFVNLAKKGPGIVLRGDLIYSQARVRRVIRNREERLCRKRLKSAILPDLKLVTWKRQDGGSEKKRVI